MQQLSPKAQFDALANLLQFDAASVDVLRVSLKPLLGSVNELVRRVDEMMKRPEAESIFGEFSRERMQSLLASFIMRVINCNFDEAFCDYAREVSSADDVPPGLFSIGLTLANDFAARTLAEQIDNREQLADMLATWNRLTAILKELTAKP
jgi:hypothetical protein